MKAVALSPGDTLGPELLPPELAGRAAAEPVAEPSPMMSLEEMERLHVERVLRAVQWHRGRACEVLGVSRPRLRRMMNQYNLEPPPGLDTGP